ncbi:MAG: DUF523 domain-containing protein [Desulfovibrio sp.]|nr:DUF523 domain-containing protein [Desulfovibrio sp.]
MSERQAKCLVSACLAGFPCRYDGKTKTCDAIAKLYKLGLARPICPESLSGLAVPREPTEKRGEKYFSRSGKDVTENILRGAEKAFQKADQSDLRVAILKGRSPSCGVGEIYDGSFTGATRPGNGAFAQKLLDAGFSVYTEENIPDAILELATSIDDNDQYV